MARVCAECVRACAHVCPRWYAVSYANEIYAMETCSTLCGEYIRNPLARRYLKLSTVPGRIVCVRTGTCIQTNWNCPMVGRHRPPPGGRNRADKTRQQQLLRLSLTDLHMLLNLLLFATLATASACGGSDQCYSSPRARCSIAMRGDRFVCCARLMNRMRQLFENMALWK